MRNESELLGLVIYLVEQGASLDLGPALYDALLSHLEEIHERNASMTDLEADRGAVINTLSGHWRQTLLRNVRDFILDEAEKKLTSVLTLYGRPLWKSAILAEKADEVVRRLFVEIVAGHVTEELAWMEAALEHRPEILNRCSADSREALRDRVRDALSAEDLADEDETYMRQIAKTLRVRPRRKKRS